MWSLIAATRSRFEKQNVRDYIKDLWLWQSDLATQGFGTGKVWNLPPNSIHFPTYNIEYILQLKSIWFKAVFSNIIINIEQNDS